MKRSYWTRGIVRVLAVASVLSLATLSSQATLLNFTLQPYPDLNVNYLSMNYTAGHLHVEGSLNVYTDPSNNQPDVQDFGSYTLDADITSGAVLTSGSFTLAADIGNGSETLLTGDLNLGAEGSAFGASSDPRLEFLYAVTGGSLSNDFGGIGAAGGIDMYPGAGGTGFTDSWAANWSNGGNGYADHAPLIPEPSSIFLLVLGTALCVATHRRHKHARVP